MSGSMSTPKPASSSRADTVTKARTTAKALAIVAILLAAPAAAWAQTDPAQCEGELAAAREAGVAQLPFDAFDQSEDSGWRPLAAHGCYRAAALLVDEYAAHGPDGEANLTILRFHAGQMYAFAGDYPDAIERFEESYQDRALVESLAEEGQVDMSRAIHGWNVYVDATLAFLRRDRGQLEAHRQELAELADDGILGTEINLRAVDRLLNGFENSYADAYGGG